jgi:hypothetical protein
VVVAPNVAPVVTLSSATTKAKTFLKSGKVVVNVTSNESVTVLGEVLGKGRIASVPTIRTLSVGDLVIGTGSLSTGSGTRALTVKFGAARLKVFRAKLTTKAQRKKGIAISVDVTATDAGGISTSATHKVLIKGQPPSGPKVSPPVPGCECVGAVLALGIAGRLVGARRV